MANAERDELSSGEDMVPIADGGGPFQEFDDVPGKTSKQLGTTSPDSKRGQHLNGGVSKGGLAGR